MVEITECQKSKQGDTWWSFARLATAVDSIDRGGLRERGGGRHYLTGDSFPFSPSGLAKKPRAAAAAEAATGAEEVVAHASHAGLF